MPGDTSWLDHNDQWQYYCGEHWEKLNGDDVILINCMTCKRNIGRKLHLGAGIGVSHGICPECEKKEEANATR